MNLDDYLNENLGATNTPSNLWSTPKFNAVTDIFGGIENVGPIMATTTWQTLLESPDLNRRLYPNALKHASYQPALNHQLEKYLLCLGNGQYCLLVFDPTMTTDDPIYIDASKGNTKQSIRSGYGIWKSKIASTVNHMYLRNMNNLYGFGNHNQSLDKFSYPFQSIYNQNTLDLLESDLFEYSIDQIEWPIIVCKPPERILSCYHPDESHGVAVNSDGSYNSLAGIYTQDVSGDYGATVCLHCFPNSYVEIGKTQVIIHGLQGIVKSVNNITDSCFVKLDLNESQITQYKPYKGPLLGVTPREFESCFFYNRDGKKIKSEVIGWSPDILNYEPYNQVKVLTSPHTNPGDSGTALIDNNGNVLGFAFYRTGLDALKQFSAWIWAASVFKSHNLIS
ncbi:MULTISPECIES: hypothetical protein [Olivibacter]|uniref:Trypsin-like peptidase n=1 Tax=Olivibacter jilunii TaxID=985016 RepID=A0ABW6B438_9SPHI|nr:hypothetical protein [Olivibacter jilunii]